jgi:biopolymer transport protein ExbD
MTKRSNVLRKMRYIEEPAVNLTPLIDVVFVILIMFILVAPLLELDRVELAQASVRPASGEVSVQESGPIAIHVEKDNTIIFNHRPVSAAQLETLLKQAKKEYPEARPQVFHDYRGHFGVYQTIKNAAEMAGYEQIDIILKPAS